MTCKSETLFMNLSQKKNRQMDVNKPQDVTYKINIVGPVMYTAECILN